MKRKTRQMLIQEMADGIRNQILRYVKNDCQAAREIAVAILKGL